MISENILKTIECQFLCCYPLKYIDWQQTVSNHSWEDQKLLLDHTYNSSPNKNHPISLNYQLNYLKKLIQQLEECSDEVHDEIYEAFCNLQVASKKEEKFSFKHYSLPKYNTVITLKESRSFVADGTTGLCSWQASLALSDWLLHNGDVVRGKSVIELGSGTGLCGFIVSRCCGTEKVFLTDGSAPVIEILNENMKLNFTIEDQPQGRLSIVHLPWESCELVETKRFDVILAADVVYDSSEFGNLMHAIDHLFRLMENKVHMVLAATVRNKATLEEFLCLLESYEFTVEDKEVVPVAKSNLYWDRSTPVRIMILTRNKRMS